MRWLVPIVWFAVAAGVYVTNQGDSQRLALWGTEYLVGPDPDLRGQATVGIAVLFGVLSSVSPIASLFRKPEAESDDE